MLARGVPSSSFMIIVPARAVYLIASPLTVIVCDVVEMLSFGASLFSFAEGGAAGAAGVSCAATGNAAARISVIRSFMRAFIHQQPVSSARMKPIVFLIATLLATTVAGQVERPATRRSTPGEVAGRSPKAAQVARAYREAH